MTRTTSAAEAMCVIVANSAQDKTVHNLRWKFLIGILDVTSSFAGIEKKLGQDSERNSNRYSGIPVNWYTGIPVIRPPSGR